MDVGLGEPVVVVSNAPKLAVGMRVVIATVGAIVDGEAVKKTSIGGAKSEVPHHRAAYSTVAWCLRPPRTPAACAFCHSVARH